MMPGDTFGQWLNLLFRLVLAKEEDRDRNSSRKITNYGPLFLKSRIIRVFRRKRLDFEPEKLP
jgi:hypothetical protein